MLGTPKKAPTNKAGAEAVPGCAGGVRGAGHLPHCQLPATELVPCAGKKKAPSNEGSETARLAAHLLQPQLRVIIMATKIERIFVRTVTA
jgi:hypothetical protein